MAEDHMDNEELYTKWIEHLRKKERWTQVDSGMVEVAENLVDRFKEVCEVEDDQAKRFLQHCDGNLEEAVQLFFSTGGNLDNSNEGAQNAQNADMELRQRRVQNLHEQPAPIRRVPAQPARPGWVQWIVAILTLPVNFVFTTVWDIIQFLAELFLSRSRPAVLDPIGDVTSFIDYYSSIPTGNPLPFVRTSFSEAARTSKTQHKPLIIYLHSNTQESDRFVRDVLNSEELRTFVANNELVIWGAGVDRPEGRNVAFNLRVRSFPMFGLALPNEGRMTLALRVSPPIEARDLALNLNFTLHEFTAQRNLAMLERAQREADARLRDEQNREYEESARRDRERAEAKKMEEERLRQEQLALETEERKKKEREERILSHRNSVSPSSSGALRVQVRFPRGEKAVLNFEPEQPVTELFDAIIAQPACPNYFAVSTTFPKKALQVAPSWYVSLCEENERVGGSPLGCASGDKLTIEEAGIQNGVALMVTDLCA